MANLNLEFSNSFKLVLTFLLFFTYGTFVFSQDDTPCECAQRWTGGGTWNPDGTINDLPNAPAPNGIVRCGSSAETQSQLEPGNCVYNPATFEIDVSGLDCIDPSTGNIVNVINPTSGQPIIWHNFDVRAFASSFQIQINDNSMDNVGWALYVSDNPTNSTSGPANLSGDCNALTLVACGVESSSTWNTLPVPDFSTTSNFYMAIWDQDADDNLSINNFKARYGCGDNNEVVVCRLEDDVITDVICADDGNTFMVMVEITGSNGEFEAVDGAANSISDNVCLGNLKTGDLMGTFILTYDYDENYNITIQAVSPPTISGCADPDNPDECALSVSGGPPDGCEPCPCTEIPAITGDLTVDLGCNPLMDRMMGLLGNVSASTPDPNCALSMIMYEDGPTQMDNCNRSKVRTYSVYTFCGMLIGTFEQNIVWVEDDGLPVITTNATNGDQGCGDPGEPIFSGNDNCDGNFVPDVTTSGPVQDGCNFSQTWFANYTDQCGNPAQEVSISWTWRIDNEPPVISTNATNGDQGCGDPGEPVFSGNDNCDGNFVPDVTTSGPIQDGCNFSQTWIANYTDQCGNPAQEVSISWLWIQDEVSLVIQCPPNVSGLTCSDQIPSPDVNSVQIVSACVPDLVTIEFVDDDPDPASFNYCEDEGPFVVTRTYSATDGCGNVAFCQQTFTFAPDTEGPICPADWNLTIIFDPTGCNVLAPYEIIDDVLVDGTPTDNCSDLNSLTVELASEILLPAECAPGQNFLSEREVQRSYIFYDGCGNPSDICSQSIIYQISECVELDDFGTIGINGQSTIEIGQFCDPPPLTSVNTPSGSCGIVEYMWLYSTEVNENGLPYPVTEFNVGTIWFFIEGATQDSYDPGPLEISTFFVRCARNFSCCNYGESNTVSIFVNSELPSCEEPAACEEAISLVSPDDDLMNGESVYHMSNNPINAENTIGTGAQLTLNGGNGISFHSGFKTMNEALLIVQDSGCPN